MLFSVLSQQIVCWVGVGVGGVLHMKVWSLMWAHLLMSTELELTKKCTHTLMEAAALS